MMAIDLTGLKFGKLTVIEKTDRKIHRYYYWLCQCECGNKKEIISNNLRRGLTNSCGCIRRQAASINGKKSKHGLSHSVEYSTWRSMIERCNNPNRPNYKDYGGRGIRVCDRWVGESGFKNFYSDMGKRPSLRHSIDRYPNNDGDYEPSNCRWATGSEQQRNKRVKIIIFEGASKTVKEWAKAMGISEVSMRWRLCKWPLKKALTKNYLLIKRNEQ